MKFIKCTILIFVLLAITACTNGSNTNVSEITSGIDTSDLESQLYNLIDLKLSDELEVEYTIEILDIYRNVQDVFSKFIILNSETNYEGILYSQYNNDDLVLKELHYNELGTDAITQSILGGSLDHDIKQRYTVVSGTINDPQITSIRITYFDNHLTVLQIGKNQKSYFDTRIGNDKGVKSIISLNKRGAEVKSLKWYK